MNFIDWLFAITWTLVILLLGLFVVACYHAAFSGDSVSLMECAKAHNVYKCEWVAMPVGNLEMPE